MDPRCPDRNAYLFLSRPDPANLPKLRQAAQERNHVPLRGPVLLPGWLRVEDRARSRLAKQDQLRRAIHYLVDGQVLILVQYPSSLLRDSADPSRIPASHQEFQGAENWCTAAARY